MKLIRSKREYEKLLQEIFDIMNKGEKNLTDNEQKKVRSIGLAIQEYELKLYPIKMPS